MKLNKLILKVLGVFAIVGFAFGSVSCDDGGDAGEAVEEAAEAAGDAAEAAGEAVEEAAEAAGDAVEEAAGGASEG